MSFSGTISQTVFNTRRVIDHAMRRCKIPAQTIAGEHLDIAKDVLYLLLSDLANGPVPLWCIERQVYPVVDGVAALTTDTGTVDVLNGNWRTLQMLSPTVTTTSATETRLTLDDAASVTSIGVVWSAAPPEIAIDVSDDALTWTQIQTETLTAAAGDQSWIDLDNVAAHTYYRIRAVTGTLGITSADMGNMPVEIPLGRMNRDDWTALPNKSFKSQRTLQYWFDRQVNQPVLRLWPVPDSTAEGNGQIVIWRQRHIMDVGTLAQEIEVPQRWYEAIVATLAAKLALEITEVDPQLIPMLDAKAAQAMATVLDEERDNSPITIMPLIGAYTR